MIILVAYVFSALGVAYILGHSVISLPVRTWLADFAVAKWLGYECLACGEPSVLTAWKENYPYRTCPRCVCPNEISSMKPSTLKSKPFAWLVELIECEKCLGFHLGWIYAVACGPIFSLAHQPIADAILLGFFTSGTNLLLGRITNMGHETSTQDERKG